MLDLSKATHEQFEPYLNQTFSVAVDSSPTLELELIGVETRGSAEASANTRQAFSLLFRGPNDSGLEQRIFVLTHESLGTLELFLVPIGPDNVGMIYEAVFT